MGLDYQTLRNYAWVVRQFELRRRREKLSFQHHAEVASLPSEQQDFWLDRAESERWSRNQLRKHVRDSRRGPQSPESKTLMPRLTVTADRAERWHAAAEESKTTFENWVLAALDHAAARAVPRTDDTAGSSIA